MGNLLTMFRKTNVTIRPTTVVDFENAQPTDDEKNVHEMVLKEMEAFPEIIEMIKSYNGAEEQIKQVVQQPNDDSAKQGVWTKLEPLIRLLKKSHDVAERMEKFFPALLDELCDGDNPLHNFEKKQALSKLLATILDFTMEFDIIKINKPYIQNDFSYYRRTISRTPLSSDGSSLIICQVQGDIMNNILLFLANPCPFMTKISDCTIKQFKSNNRITLDGITNCFATLAHLCKYMAETPGVYENFQSVDTRFYCVRVMVSLIVLYDNVHPTGVFTKGSEIEIKTYAKFLKEQEIAGARDLLNTIKYTSKHFNDVNTPSSIKSIFA